MQSVELNHEGLEIKFFETTPEHAKEYGFKATKPIYIEHLLVDVKKRNRGNGTQLLKMIQEYCENNKFDLIFGTIPNYAQFTKNSKYSLFSDNEMIKSWLFRNGYAINPDNNDFHKVFKKEKPLTNVFGIGFDNCNENGKYEVVTKLERKEFSSLSKAKTFYDSVKGEKSIYDSIINELIDAWYNK
jgi:GNAT superfamily N-acetyltransferase